MENKDNKYTDVMLDLETFGLKPGCQILSIGAVVFNSSPNYNTAFYATIKPGDNRFTVDPKTLDWWKEQKPDVFQEATSGILTTEVALMKLAQFLSQFQEVRVWGNAASFDLKILERAYEICNIPLPWRYYNEMCYRTLKNLFPSIQYIKPAIPHNALQDAVAQAKHAEEIMRHLVERDA